MRDNFVKQRKVAERLGLTTSLKRGTGGCNPCFRPARDASKSDLSEFHAEDMKLRRAGQLNRVPNSHHPLSGSIALGNRNIRNIATANPAPHEDQREKARRLRQMGRRA